MKAQWLLAGGLAIALSVVAGCKKKGHAGHSMTRDEMAKEQTVCPVMSDEIDKSLYADHMGKRVYFCCDRCPPMFNKDPMKYMKKLEAEGVTLNKTPAGAPGSGHEAMERGGEHKEMERGAH